MPAPVRARLLLLAIAYAGFISLGLPDTLIGVAWPFVRDTFALPQSAAALVFFGSGCSYFFSSFFTGRLLKIFGIGTLLAASSALVALSQFGYGMAGAWLLFASCSLLHGLGSGAIDAGLNHYVAHHFSARHMNWLHACYALGATLGPLIMTTVIATSGSWRSGYLTVATTLLVLAVLFVATRRSWDEPQSDEPLEAQAAVSAGILETLRHPLVWLQIAIFFVYTGLEVTVGQWSFTLLTESRGVAQERAGFWVTVYWGSLCAGRFLFGFVVNQIGIDRLVRFSLAASLLGAALVSTRAGGFVPAIGLSLAGLGLAPVFPCLMTRTPGRLGADLAAHAIGFQVSAAMLGAAALPSLAGVLAQRVGLEAVPMIAVTLAVLLFLLHERLVARSRAAI
jgi:fucose permease